MPDSFSYAIAGQGRWAGRMHSVLAGEGRRTFSLAGTRLLPGESTEGYKLRLRESFVAADAQIAWLCVPPGRHVAALAEAALEAGLHVVVEKPWLCSRDETRALEELAANKKLLAAIHYEYCFLDAVEEWRRDFGGANGMRFGGVFHLHRADHLGLLPLDNLGTHLLAIREYAARQSVIGDVDCGYERTEERRVWLEREKVAAASIDFLGSKEPIIQRFIASFEGAIGGGASFPFGLQFALEVAEAVNVVKARHGDRIEGN